MKKITNKEFIVIMENHQKWQNSDGGERAYFKKLDLRGCDLRGCNLDFSCLDLSCRTLQTIFDQRHIIQFLYHAAMPAQNNDLGLLDDDLKELFESELFKKVVNKFHRVKECSEFTGIKK